MQKLKENSIIEVWNDEYINHPNIRENEDKDKIVVQCEHTHSNEFIVEVVEKPDKHEDECVKYLKEKLLNKESELLETKWEFNNIEEKLSYYKIVTIVLSVACALLAGTVTIFGLVI